MTVDHDKVTEAVKELIRAEWHFRCGPQAYTTTTTDWIYKAERKLRRALTGTGDLDAAFKVLKVAGEEESAT